MQFVQSFFAFIVDFAVFMITGRTIQFATMFDGLQTFFESFGEVKNIFAWADALLPIEVIRVLLALITLILLLHYSMKFAAWLIDIITL